MTERFRSPAARELVKAIRKAGGTVERIDFVSPEPRGTATIQEPASESRKNLQRNSAQGVLREQTGLSL